MSTPTLIDLLSEVRRDIATAEAEVAKLRGIEEYLSGKLARSAMGGTTLPRVPLESAVIHANGATVRHGGVSAKTHPVGMRPGINQGDAAEIALRELGGHAHVADILKTMLALGYQNPNNTTDIDVLKNSIYSAMLRSPERFERIGRGTWQLKEESHPSNQRDDDNWSNEGEGETEDPE